MKSSKAVLDRYMQILTPHGPITSRAMFGGFGIYYDRVMFATIIENELYFRVDENFRNELENLGSHPFIYERQRKPVELPYMTLPEEILKDPTKLKEWIKRSYTISLNNRRKKKNSRKR